jgi:alpha/beta hydrolase fold
MSPAIGTSATKVCIVGDSAGANLAVAVSLKALACGIRQPDGILSIYGCLLIKYAPSPSRILALLDPLLPIGLLSLCLHGLLLFLFTLVLKLLLCSLILSVIFWQLLSSSVAVFKSSYRTCERCIAFMVQCKFRPLY